MVTKQQITDTINNFETIRALLGHQSLDRKTVTAIVENNTPDGEGTQLSNDTISSILYTYGINAAEAANINGDDEVWGPAPDAMPTIDVFNLRIKQEAYSADFEISHEFRSNIPFGVRNDPFDRNDPFHIAIWALIPNWRIETSRACGGGSNLFTEDRPRRGRIMGLDRLRILEAAAILAVEVGMDEACAILSNRGITMNPERAAHEIEVRAGGLMLGGRPWCQKYMTSTGKPPAGWVTEVMKIMHVASRPNVDMSTPAVAPANEPIADWDRDLMAE